MTLAAAQFNLTADLAETRHRRANVGSGICPLAEYTNVDRDQSATNVDIVAAVPPLPFETASLDDIYAGHFVEHLTPEEASVFLTECHRCLVPGGRLGIVVPDTREIVRRYLRGGADYVEFPEGTRNHIADLDAVCRLFLYSTTLGQSTPHRWSYDQLTLFRLMERHGFDVIGEIDRMRDVRIAVHSWYSFGLDSVRK